MRIGLVALAVAVLGCSSIESTKTAEHAVTMPTVTTSASSYAPGQAIGVSWDGLPGNANDWVAIAPDGSPPTTVLRWAYTGGAAMGSTSFSGLSNGNYVARAFLDDSYAQLAESTPFTVTGTTVTADRRAYASGPITVTWSGLPGTSTDWVGIAPAGSPATTVTSWVYTGGAPSGSHAFSMPAAGTYVARAFPEDSYSIAGESAAFETGTSVTTDPSYVVGDPITVTWSHLTSNVHDWVSISPAGSSETTVLVWAYTNGASGGSHTFGGLAAGTYVARAYFDDSYQILVESTQFVVGGSPPPPPPVGSITIEHPTYGWGQDITITWSGFPTNAHDWITLAPQGSPDTTTTVWFYTGGLASGSHTFVNGVPAIGTYVARGFLDDSSTRIAESTSLTIQDSCVDYGPSAGGGMVSNEIGEAVFKNTVSYDYSLTITTDVSNGEYTLPCLETVNGDLTIIQGDPSSFQYRHLKGVHLPRLRTVTGRFAVADVERLTLGRIQSVGSLVISGTYLEDLSALTGLSSTGSIVVRSAQPTNNVIQNGVNSLHGLEGITSVAGKVEIILNSNIVDLSGLDNLATIGGDLTAYQLASLHGLDALTSVGGNVFLSAISYDVGVGSLVSVGGYLDLRVASAPKTPPANGYEATGFTNLETVGGALWLRNPHRVIFPKLSSVYDFNAYGEYLPNFVEIRAPMLTHVVNHFVVINHPNLPSCQVQAIYGHLSPSPMNVQLGNLSATCPP